MCDRYNTSSDSENMRWVSILGELSRVSAVRLQVKYGLHPLATEDLINLKRQKPKVSSRNTTASYQTNKPLVASLDDIEINVQR